LLPSGVLPYWKASGVYVWFSGTRFGSGESLFATCTPYFGAKSVTAPEHRVKRPLLALSGHFWTARRMSAFVSKADISRRLPPALFRAGLFVSLRIAAEFRTVSHNPSCCLLKRQIGTADGEKTMEHNSGRVRQAKSARSRSASVRSAPERLARSSRASLKSASHRSAALRSAPVSVAKRNEACLSRVEERSMGPPLIGPICRSPTLKVRPLRLGTTSGFSERHAFHALGPRRKISIWLES
jgi:hypothetical protein